MGSLLPGWDAESGIPKGFEPDDEALKIDVDDSHEPLSRLSRQSFGSRHSREEAASPSSPRARPPKDKPVLKTRSTPLGGLPGFDAQRSFRAVRRYPTVDWTEELASLRPARKAQSAADHHPGVDQDHGEDSHGAAEHGGGQGAGISAWWRALDVGHLNEHPDAVEVEEPRHGHRGAAPHSTFIPQTELTRKLSSAGREVEAADVADVAHRA